MANPHISIPELTSQDIARFWSYIKRGPPSKCWPWAGSGTKRYGSIKLQRRHYRSHRVAWRLAYGPIPRGMCVCHHCDNGMCCNPAHLWLGTQADNMRDMRRKGRGATGSRNGAWLHPERIARGERAGLAKLTAKDVQDIRRRRAAGGCTLAQLARSFNVDLSNIGHIVARRTWAHVP